MAVFLIDIYTVLGLNFRCGCFRILWVKFKFAKVIMCVVVYGPIKDENDEREGNCPVGYIHKGGLI